MPESRKHHYVPRFYLSGFTAPQSTRLYVLNKETGQSYQSNPNDAGCERDFYTVEVEDAGDPLAVERFLASIETAGAEAIRHIVQHHSIPDGELYGKLIAFLAVMSIRGPGAIDMIEKPFAQVIKTVLWYATRSKEAFDQFMGGPAAEGKEHVEGMTYEQACDFVRSDQYSVSMGQNFKMSLLLDMMKTIEPLLAARHWSVVQAAERAPDFICSDRPLNLCWTVHTPGPYGPAFGLKNTTAMFPLSRRLALLGLFEKINVPRELIPKAVGSLNMFTAIHAKQFVYSGSDEFTVLLADGTTTGRNGFLNTVKRPVATNPA